MSAKDFGAPPKARVVHSTLSSRIGMTFWILLTAALVALPYWGDRQMMRLATEIYSFVALASLWNFLAGYAGLVSVGQQTFVGLGGYTLYLCALWAGLNPMVGLPLAGVIGALISVPIVLLLLKLRGAYFTIGSWVVAEVFLQIFQLVPAVGGGSGISLPAKVVQSIAGSRSGRESLIYWIFLGLAVAVIGVIVLLLRTRYGLALQAIRDNETAAKSNGIDVNRARMVVFVVAAAATAMVGSMVFLQKLSITPFSAFSINDWTVNMIFITVIGGIGRVEGPIVGTVIFFVLREFLADLASTYLIILGVVAIGVMLKAPKGIWGYAADRLGWQLFPLARRLVRGTAGKGGRQALHTGAAGHSSAPPPTEPAPGLP
jgi:branched-chain amino acid transport system permease protein